MSSWINLTDGKRLSRLLYTNPVCFLCVRSSTSEHQLPHEASANETANETITDNVMVLSWLTATNNEGNFVFSVCKRRYTASLLVEGKVFTLSVPVKGMEKLVLHVGGISGRFGSKFSSHSNKDDESLSHDFLVPDDGEPLSKRQKKKMMRQKHGVPGLRRIDCFERHDSFAIEGTVAHILCSVSNTLSEHNPIDDDHTLFVARILEAHVHPSYWNSEKNLFQPKSADDPPYLTFFGSQTFGYVVQGK
jgi:flavin reductase (DIM6/NTAB) family NADH-FMN oxidoreductase RutF